MTISVALSTGPIHLGLDTSKNAIAVGTLRPDEVSPDAEKIFNDEPWRCCIAAERAWQA